MPQPVMTGACCRPKAAQQTQSGFLTVQTPPFVLVVRQLEGLLTGRWPCLGPRELLAVRVCGA